MGDTELGTVLAVLRIVRGMNQEELARASGLRGGTISDYERGKIVPGLNTVQRILDAMGYPFGALDRARSLINALRPENLAEDSAQSSGHLDGPEALHWEVEQVSAEAGRVVSRLTRLLFVVMNSTKPKETGGDLQSSE
jgi:transcriptional regulator with XRE-family HTH domain